MSNRMTRCLAAAAFSLLVGTITVNAQVPTGADPAKADPVKTTDPVKSASPGDSFTKDSVWDGSLTQEGQYPNAKLLPSMKATLTVKSRDKDKASFTAEFRVYTDDKAADVTYLVQGKVTAGAGANAANSKVAFSSIGVKEAKAGIAVTTVQYGGYLVAGKAATDPVTLAGDWEYPANTQGISMFGSFTTTLKK